MSDVDCTVKPHVLLVNWGLDSPTQTHTHYKIDLVSGFILKVGGGRGIGFRKQATFTQQDSSVDEIAIFESHPKEEEF